MRVCRRKLRRPPAVGLNADPDPTEFVPRHDFDVVTARLADAVRLLREAPVSANPSLPTPARLRLHRRWLADRRDFFTDVALAPPLPDPAPTDN